MIEKIEKASKAFSGIRSFGIFAPMSYWKSKEDWGIGDIDVLLKVIDFAKQHRISTLSMLPLNLPITDNCPYSNASAYIFDPVYIGLDLMCRMLDVRCPAIEELIVSLCNDIEKFRESKVSLNEDIRESKYKVFKMLYRAYDLSASVRFREYCASHSWLEDHLLFFILAKQFGTYDFRLWQKKIALRDPDTIRALKQEYRKEIKFEAFLQWVLTQQLRFVREKANEGDFTVDLMFDQPFAFGSADVWCNPDAFVIDPETLKCEFTQGAPPHRLDIPQHWQFYLLNTETSASKRILIERLSFMLQFCDLLRIDHLLGYYRLYYLSEDPQWQMTLQNMGIYNDIEAIFHGDVEITEKRTRIYELILQGIQENFPADIVSELFDESGNLRHAHVILAARKQFDFKQNYELYRCGWYRQYSAEHAQDLLYAMLNPNEISDADYLEKIIRDKELFLKSSDSIRVGFFKPGFGEEIIYPFMKIAQEQGKHLIFENLGVVPEEISRSLAQLGATEFKPLIFGYMKFVGDDNAFWAEHIEYNSFACFSTQDTVTLRGWWEGKEKWAKQKFYLHRDKAKVALLHWLFENKYLSEDAEIDLRTLTPDLQKAVLASVSDCKARDVVISMPDIFGSGDDGIINMPGNRGFWTARCPIAIEDFETKGKEAVELINMLNQYRSRDSFDDQVRDLNPEMPHLLATHPRMGAGTKQLRIHGEAFLIDAVVYGKCDTASVIFDSGRIEAMQKLDLKYGNSNNIKLFRCSVPVDENMIGVFGFKIALDGNIRELQGYLIGCTPGTDMNPLSANYGNSKP